MDSALPPLVHQMLQPGFYSHPVCEPIGLVQTHVSYVFLTGDRVYKLKKPVNFGFLDYSTLEKRKECCDRELELNRRAASEIYIGVVPISQTGETYQLGDVGDSSVTAPVEYAVVMHQFPQEGLLSNLFERGELTADLIRRLARVLAEFHQASPTNEYIRAFGLPDRVKVAFDENFDQTEGFIDFDAGFNNHSGPQTREQFETTKTWSESFFANHADLLQERVDRGWIRNGHGDPHLGNICLWNDRLLLFDCIEFNEPFRYVDVMYDVAFIVMDLRSRDRPDLANLFVNEYVERTGDWEGLAVLPLYINRQTYVRAKVTSFLLGDPAVPEADRRAAFDRASRYYRQAYEDTRSQTGRLWVMSGLSGSGKTTTARRLAEANQAIILRSDAVRKHLAGVPLDERGPQSIYSAEMTEQTYDRLTQLAVMLAQRGYGVVLDAKYDRQAYREAVLDAAEQANLPVALVHCTAPMDVLRDRLNQRQGDIADATADLLAAQAAAFEPFSDREQGFLRSSDQIAYIAIPNHLGVYSNPK